MKHISYIIIGVVLCTTLPFFLLFGNLDWSVYAVAPQLFWTQFASITASVLGLIGLVLCLWQVVLGARMVTRLYTADLLTVNRIHQRIGIYGGAFVLLHPLLEAYAYGESILFTFIPAFHNEFALHVTFGRLAAICFYVLWITSAVVRGKIAYRPWLYLHYLAYPVVILSLLHIREVGTVLASQELLRSIFISMLPVVIILLCARIAYACGIFQKKYRVTAVTHVGQTVVFQVVPQGKRIVPLAGQFCYIQLRPFGESHPFSVMDYDEATGALTFGIKTFGKYSKKMFEITIDTEIFLDGPFGVFCAEGRSATPKVLIAGGIGITPLYHLVQKHNSAATYLLNCNRTTQEAVGRSTLQYALGNRYVDVLSQEQLNEESVVCGKLTEEVLRQRVPAEMWNTAHIFFCGNPGFYAAVKTTLRAMGVPESRIHFEAFSL